MSAPPPPHAGERAVPDAARRGDLPSGGIELELTLPVSQPFDAVSLRRFLDAHVVAGLDAVDPVAATTTRSIDAPGGPAVATIFWERGPALAVRLTLWSASDEAFVVATLRRWLDLDARPDAVVDALGGDARLGPLVSARPGLRIPGAVNGAETALFTVLGQQVSLAAARTFQGRLVSAISSPTALGFRASPDPAAVAEANTDELREALGITRSRVAALQALARVLADGLELAPGVDPVEARLRLLAVRGIGPWTADYVALRCLRDDDAFPAGDLILRRTLGASTSAEAIRLSEPWRPWRAYATLHLWTEAVFVDPQPATP